MKTIKLKIEKTDLESPAVVAAVNSLLLALGGHSTISKPTPNFNAGGPTTVGEKGEEVVQPVKETRKKVKEVPQVDVEKEKAKETLAELKEEKAAEAPKDLAEDLAELHEKQTAKIDLATVREALGLKVGEHRETIKAKLTELGANNVSTLSPDHYQTMHDFLTGL